MKRKFLKKAEAAILMMALIFSMPGNVKAAPDKTASVKAEKLTVTAKKKTLYVGWTKGKKTVKLKVSVTPKEASKQVSYQSSDTSVLTVSKKGKVTAVKKGKAVITVTSKSNPALKETVTLKVKKTALTFAKKEASVTLNGDPSAEGQKLKIYGAKGAVEYASDKEEILSVDENGTVTAKRRGQAVVTAEDSSGKKALCTVTVTGTNPAIHDPSVYRDPVSGTYYSFGSHLAAAKSDDLMGWSTAANSPGNYSSASTLFTKKYTEEFAEPYAFTMPGGAKENAWAPDIIYNTSMKKYCMYLSIVDGSTKCCIAMAVSDQPDGPYSYQGMIVCSGLETDGSDVEKTNIAEALGISEAEAKESKYVSIGKNSPDCIDPTVFYDHNGSLWMVYGSFTTTGGIRLLKLDPDTGLRGENYKDSGDGTKKKLSTDDPYYGKKIANSNGEGPYIQMLEDKNSSTGYYYYLWTSTGNLQYYGGYNMRLVRAENPEGPYYDPKGNKAVKNLQKYALGLRVMDNYKFSFMDSAYVSQGGNSATEDGNGKTFIQFHTRTSASDSFTMRTHQTFLNEEGWLVTAPYEYNGETIAESYDPETVAGEYEFIYHRNTFAKTATDDMDERESENLVLQPDGTVSGAYSGTWTLNGHYITITIDDAVYKGVVLEQYEQTDAREKTMVFTAVGADNRSVWGSKIHKTEEEAVKDDMEWLTEKINRGIAREELWDRGLALPEEGLFGSRITWSSTGAVKLVVKAEGEKAQFIRNASDTAEAVLTANLVKGGSNEDTSFSVTVPAAPENNLVVYDNIPEKDEYETVVYEEDYSGMVNDKAIAEVWTCKDEKQQACLYAEADETHDSFIKFAGGNTGSSKGAETIFPDKVQKNYRVDFDVALNAGTAEETQFAITGTDCAFQGGDGNAGIESGYILKLSAVNSQQWTVNDGEESVTLPFGWVHVMAVTGEAATKAAIVISDKEAVYYAKEVAVNGTGEVNGLYLRWGTKQALVSVDNVSVRSR